MYDPTNLEFITWHKQFIIQQTNIKKDKLTTFHGYFQPNLISRKKWLKRITCINNDFYVITLWMHYTLFVIVFRRITAVIKLLLSIEFSMYQIF